MGAPPALLSPEGWRCAQASGTELASPLGFTSQPGAVAAPALKGGRSPAPTARLPREHFPQLTKRLLSS